QMTIVQLQVSELLLRYTNDREFRWHLVQSILVLLRFQSIASDVATDLHRHVAVLLHCYAVTIESVGHLRAVLYWPSEFWWGFVPIDHNTALSNPPRYHARAQ